MSLVGRAAPAPSIQRPPRLPRVLATPASPTVAVRPVPGGCAPTPQLFDQGHGLASGPSC
eukprot:3022857-Alexandrium_andersonii.AAC.1